MGEHWDQTEQKSTKFIISLTHTDTYRVKFAKTKLLRIRVVMNPWEHNRVLAIAYSDILARALNRSPINERRGEFISLICEYYIIFSLLYVSFIEEDFVYDES